MDDHDPCIYQAPSSILARDADSAPGSFGARGPSLIIVSVNSSHRNGPVAIDVELGEELAGPCPCRPAWPRGAAGPRASRHGVDELVVALLREVLRQAVADLLDELLRR